MPSILKVHCYLLHVCVDETNNWNNALSVHYFEEQIIVVNCETYFLLQNVYYRSYNHELCHVKTVA